LLVAEVPDRGWLLWISLEIIATSREISKSRGAGSRRADAGATFRAGEASAEAREAGAADGLLTAGIGHVIGWVKPPPVFDAADVVVSGSAGASNVSVVGSGTSYAVTVVAVSDSGGVKSKVPAGSVSDAPGNPSLPAMIVSGSVVINDETAPVLVVPDSAVTADTDPGEPDAVVEFEVGGSDPGYTVSAQFT